MQHEARCDRCGVLVSWIAFEVADAMRRHKFTLPNYASHKCTKPWKETLR